MKYILFYTQFPMKATEEGNKLEEQE